jgi:hypothetical protein
MNTRSTLIVLALLGVACGPPKLIGDASDSDSESGEATTGDATTDEVPANPSTSSHADTSTSETDTGDSDTNETNQPFVAVSEVGGCECDPFVQDCPEGEKCVPYDATAGGSWDANKCMAVTGDQATGEPCVCGGLMDATDDCDATGICVDRDGDTLGTCHAFCMGTADQPECPDNLLCEIAEYGTVALCVEQCHPLLQDCEQPSACSGTTPGFIASRAAIGQLVSPAATSMTVRRATCAWKHRCCRAVTARTAARRSARWVWKRICACCRAPRACRSSTKARLRTASSRSAYVSCRDEGACA